MRLLCTHDEDTRKLQGQVDDLSKTVDALKRERAALNTAFEEMTDKVLRWMQRTQKRDRDAERAAGVAESAEVSEQGPWSRHPVVRRVMARRGLLPNGDE